MEKISEEPSVGFVGPKTYFYDFEGKDNVLTFAGGSLNLNKGMSQSTGFGEVDHGQYDEIKTVEYVEGSCILTKREVLEKIGFLDPKYFAYWEETDLCIRGKNEGYSSVFVPEAVIWHKVSSSVPNPTMIYYMNRNMFWFMKKYAKRNEFISFILYFFCYKFWNMNFRYFYNSIYKMEFNDNKAFIRGVKDGLFH
jgi:GT2 family glycosyltransferase